MTHWLRAIGTAGGRVIQHWVFICSCGESFEHRSRAGAKAAFWIHAAGNNTASGHEGRQ